MAIKNVLIVDDSAFMRESIKKILTKNGYHVIGEAENGKIGVEKYKELSPDIVTLDITMMEMNGLDALKEIIEYDSDAHVLMVSAMAGQDWIMQDALESGAKGVLVKPFKEASVISTLNQLT